MRVVVIGGTGQVGSKLVAKLECLGHWVFPASPQTGVDIVSGNGLNEALQGADVVIDVTNKITMEREAAVAFFDMAAINIMTAEIAAGVRHHVGLSVLGSERLTKSGYIAGKVAQEQRVMNGVIPFTLLRAAQFFEVVPMMIDALTVDGVARLPHAQFQPIAAEDVANTLVEFALGDPHMAPFEIAGPERLWIDELAARFVSETGQQVCIETDPYGTFFGAPLTDEMLLPGGAVQVCSITFERWLADQKQVPTA